MITCALLIRRNLATKRDLFELQNNSSFHSTQQNTHTNAHTHILRTRDQHVLAMLFIQIIMYCIVHAPQFIYTLYAAIASNIPN
ncbi:unnamed protein product [Rotaria sp. Silwood2]|nr:unnamed protein product [Rotaria sp. Silwood2]CAF2955577.1 unnamed protein product [Rotaria sp. Silwood2]CAF3099620.1 unnamed protein product [Rotaria sp. Silwood2]CAF3315386.1 unnamed protein product [Rotaria sp. Silwood2]CAF4303013.1 unnamed protein product [Rotaria sp. Silwood2]